MKAFAAVFTREILERRFAFVVAFFAGFVPLIGSLAYGWLSPDAAEGRVLVALVGATALSAAFALLLGAAVIVGETKEKRISFYFSRPIPSGAIWAGKLLAAIAVTFATAFLAFIPGWLSGPARARSLWGLDATMGRTALAALALAVVFVLGSHAVVTVARLRSPWVALDLILGPTLVYLAAVFLRSLLRDTTAGSYQVLDTVRYAAIALTAAVLFALVLATLVQVAEGRTDTRRAHGAFSATFFGVCVMAVALLGGYSWWCTSAKATDLAGTWGGVQTSPDGTWVVANGPLRAGRGGGSFLFDASGSRSIRVRGHFVVFSPDGARAAWGEPRFGFFEGNDGGPELRVADLASGHALATGLEAGGSGWMVFSPSGRRLAIRDFKKLAAYDVSDPANPKQVAAFLLEEDGRALMFADEETLRLVPRFLNSAHRKDLVPASLEVTEFSLPSKKSIVTGRFDRETMPFLRPSADGRFLVGSRRLTEDPNGASALTLHDGRTGALVATLAGDLRSPQVRFLTGNRIAVAGVRGASARLLLFEGDQGWGAPSRSVELGPAKRVFLGGEIAPGRVALSLLPFEENLLASPRSAKLVAVDAATGAVSPLADGLVPANRFVWWSDPTLPPAKAGTPWSSLFLDADSRLVRLDPATGARTVLLGKGK